jgi:hypothetical protein
LSTPLSLIETIVPNIYFASDLKTNDRTNEKYHDGADDPNGNKDNEMCNVRILAFYGNCPHTVLPVTEGHRITASFYIQNHSPKNKHSSSPPSASSQTKKVLPLEKSEQNPPTAELSPKKKSPKKKRKQSKKTTIAQEPIRPPLSVPYRKDENYHLEGSELYLRDGSNKIASSSALSVSSSASSVSSSASTSAAAAAASADADVPAGFGRSVVALQGRLMRVICELVHEQGCLGVMLTHEYSEEAFNKSEWSGADQHLVRGVLSLDSTIEVTMYRVLIRHSEVGGEGRSVEQKVVPIYPSDFTNTTLDQEKVKKTILNNYGQPMWILPVKDLSDFPLLKSTHDEGAEHTGNDSREESWLNVYFHIVAVFTSTQNPTKRKKPSKIQPSPPKTE